LPSYAAAQDGCQFLNNRTQMNAENADLLKSGKDKAHEISKKIGPILVGTCSQVQQLNWSNLRNA
ncbi:MAG: hypothetical protein KDE34_28920, partial [Anaerolineales bacterium]|nr:hypothetical protein [Anaerolineales bacterium]